MKECIIPLVSGQDRRAECKESEQKAWRRQVCVAVLTEENILATAPVGENGHADTPKNRTSSVMCLHREATANPWT